jgi:transcription termination factor Rho
MTKAELDKKSLAELHSLAAEAGVERFRMLPRAELIAKLADEGSPGEGRAPSRGNGGEQRDRPPRRRRRRSGVKAESGEGRPQGSGREPRSAPERAPERKPAPEPRRTDAAAEPAPPSPPTTPPSGASPPRPRRRRRRRFGRRAKQGVTLPALLRPPASRQALLCAETREGCTALLRGIAADLAGDSNGPDPVALLIDPSPEELADWRRDAPRAEIVAAGQPRHASDALAQATARASSGDDVILLIDSLTRLAEAYGDPEAAKQFFDAGQAVAGSGSLTVVAALERPSSR